MQKISEKKYGQDVKAELKTVMVTENDFAHTIAKLELTADRLAAVVNRAPGRFDIVYTNGFTVETKANMRRVDSRAPALISAAIVGGYIFFETASDVNPDRFTGILRQLATLNDKYGKPVTDLFFVGFGRGRSFQYVLTPDNKIIGMTRDKHSGITSIRYDVANRRLIAILRNLQGNEILAAMDVDAFKRDPATLTQIEKWQTVTTIDAKTPVISLSRPKTDANGTKFVANLEGDAARLLTLVQDGGFDQVEWGETFKAVEIQIGHISGGDLLVGYRVTEREVWVDLTNPALDHPIAKYLG
jgi:hypothetical protein